MQSTRDRSKFTMPPDDCFEGTHLQEAFGLKVRYKRILKKDYCAGTQEKILDKNDHYCVGGQSSVMDDIEEWLSTDVKGDAAEEGVTSEEFDKFLEERAKAAEAVPTLPSPPGGEPGAVQATPSRRKPERPEDTLFAM